MKLQLAICHAILLTVVPAALATWELVSLERLVKQTDVIVIARLTDVRETTSKGFDCGSGTLTVTEVIRGRATPTDKLRLEWANPSKVICPRLEHAPHKGKAMIWLLQTSTNSTVQADYPGRVLDPKNRAELDVLLKKP